MHFFLGCLIPCRSCKQSHDQITSNYTESHTPECPSNTLTPLHAVGACISNHEYYLGAAIGWRLQFEAFAAIAEPGMFWVVKLYAVLETA